jgi:hypothetical protein
MDSIKKAVTGDAYNKPAKTEAGAFTTQDSKDAATIKGTSADPNSTGSAVGDAAEKAQDKGMFLSQINGITTC